MRCFELLGLTEVATPVEVKAAWREAASLHHPDRGGDGETFNKLRQAYEEAYAHASAPKPCTRCDGTGQVRHGLGWSSVKLVCPSCDGAGVQT